MELENYLGNVRDGIIGQVEFVLSGAIENDRQAKAAIDALRYSMNRSNGTDRDNLIHFCQIDGRKGIHNVLMRLFDCYSGRVKTAIDAFVSVDKAQCAKDIASSFVWDGFNSLEEMIKNLSDEQLAQQKVSVI